jgi:enoyl-CoA hydratase/carnithine racemase
VKGAICDYRTRDTILELEVTSTTEIIVDRPADRVGLVRLNRPAARNALNGSLLNALHSSLEELSADKEIGVVIITGEGSAFCSGADLKESADPRLAHDFWSRHERVTRSMEIHKLIPRMPKPVIAAVNGPAIAGGCGLAMSCDLVFASDAATFGYPEVRRGLVAAMVMVSLSRVVGRRYALDLLLSGRTVSASEAEHMGMVTRVVSAEQLLDEVVGYAADMAKNSPSALRLTKAGFQQISELDYDRALDYARDLNLLVAGTDDARSGVGAFGRVAGSNKVSEAAE